MACGSKHALVSALCAFGLLLPAACRTPATTLPSAVEEARWKTLAERASGLRGLPWRRSVERQAVDAGEMPRLLGEELDDAYLPGELPSASRAMQALGLLPAGYSLRSGMASFFSEAVAGFYSPLARRLFVARDEQAVPGTIALHELVHALQDQNGPLPSALLGLAEYDDIAMAIGALLEGDAMWVEGQASGRVADPAVFLAQMDTATAAASHPDVPRALRDPLVLQYPLGYRLVHDASMAGIGRAELFADPPLSSEQLLHPEKRLDPLRLDRPADVTLPRPLLDLPCHDLLRSRLGELGLRIWLEELGVPAEQSAAAAAGWDADVVVVAACGEREAIAWAWVTDSTQDARELEAAVTSAAATLGRRRGPRAGPVVVRRDGVRVLATIGIRASERARIRAGSTRTEIPDFDAFLAAHPEVGRRVEHLRARRRARLATGDAQAH